MTDRILTTTGVLCVLATFLLMSTGVQAVRAEGGEDAVRSVDPVLEAQLGRAPDVSPTAPRPTAPNPSAPRAAIPTAQPNPVQAAPERPGTPGTEVAPGVIVFNTRGYNYGAPQGEIEAGAMNYEAPPARRAP